MTDKFLPTQMLNELKRCRASMKTQNTALGDILSKSNNVLLQIEASRSTRPAASTNSTFCSYNKVTLTNLIRIIDKCIDVSNNDQPFMDSSDVDKYLETAAEKADCLGSYIRKLLAIWDIVQRMQMSLERHEIENSENEEDC